MIGGIKSGGNHHDEVVIFQRPNVFIIAWLLLAIASLVVSRGTTQQTLWYLSTAALVVWSLLEITKGANYFRRALGLVVLAMCIASLFNLGR